MSDVTGSQGGAAPIDDGDGGVATLAKKDFTSDQEVRWCPGCGDYAILSAVQAFMPELGIEPHKTVFVSGI
ncbi:MAG: 2-oxoacid:ferredoxin oxidoreductase subunit beta, partial [Actinomycetota bacterium]